MPCQSSCVDTPLSQAQPEDHSTKHAHESPCRKHRSRSCGRFSFPRVNAKWQALIAKRHILLDRGVDALTGSDVEICEIILSVSVTGIEDEATEMPI